MKSTDIKDEEQGLDLYGQIRASVSAKGFRMASLFAAKNDIRHYLHGVIIECAPQGGAYLVASDGASMLVYHDKDAQLLGSGRILVRTCGALTAACAQSRRAGALMRSVIVEGRRLSVAPYFSMAHTDLETYVMPGCAHIEPSRELDWKRVIPDFRKLKPAQPGHMNSLFLERIHKAASIGADRKKYTPVKFWAQSNESVIAVQFGDTPEAICIIMPMRDNNKNLPDLLGVINGQKKKKQNEV